MTTTLKYYWPDLKAEGYRLAQPSPELAPHFTLSPSECPTPINAAPASCVSRCRTHEAIVQWSTSPSDELRAPQRRAGNICS